jgi:hypothetical protein
MNIGNITIKDPFSLIIMPQLECECTYGKAWQMDYDPDGSQAYYSKKPIHPKTASLLATFAFRSPVKYVHGHDSLNHQISDFPDLVFTISLYGENMGELTFGPTIRPSIFWIGHDSGYEQFSGEFHPNGNGLS